MLEASLTEPETPEPKQPKGSGDKMPPTSHTLMDLIVTISIYLPRSSFVTLFSLAAVVLTKKSSDPQLIKKAYKLIPRLATTENGAAALRERSSELQSLILSTADQTPPPARRDRLLAIHEIVTYLPTSDLHFIPSVLSEVVLGCKESNEKARTAAFSLLIRLAQRTIDPDLNPAGTVIRNSLVPHMPDTAPDAPATIEEFFTMVSAGLAGSSPHMVAASVTALSRLLFEFHTKLPPPILSDLVQTIDLFLTSNNREIVRSVLGFVKVAVVSLPEDMLRPRLDSLVPNLLVWSKEHKGRLKSKVKGILERLIRRFGAPLLEGLVGEADRKFVVAIRKERERRKRKKTQAREGGEEDGDEDGEGDESHKAAATASGQPRGGEKSFNNEFDKAVYGSDMSDSDFATTDSDDASEIDIDEQGNMHASASHRKSGAASRKQQQQQQQRGERQKPGRPGAQSQAQYIRELSPESNPLDLLAPDALASISTTKPSVRFLATKTRKRAARVDADGKLLLGLDGDGDIGMASGSRGRGRGGGGGGEGGGEGGGGGEGDGEAEGTTGVNAYISAVSGPDAVRRGQRGRLKVSQGKKRGGDEMDIDDDGGVEVAKAIGREMKGGGGGNGRRGLGVEKVRGESGRVEKRGAARGGRVSGGGGRGGRGGRGFRAGGRGRGRR